MHNGWGVRKKYLMSRGEANGNQNIRGQRHYNENKPQSGWQDEGSEFLSGVD